MAREMMYGEAIGAAMTEEMQRDSGVVLYGQNLAMTERDPMLRKFGKKRVRMNYLLPFEIVSVHLLVVLIGAAYLARADMPGAKS